MYRPVVITLQMVEMVELQYMLNCVGKKCMNEGFNHRHLGSEHTA
jgi:hypothetical protein